MATTAQIQQFVNEWAGAAGRVSQDTGVLAAYVLGQWGMETDWGNQPNMGKNNPGNVGNLGGGKWQDYSTQGDFVKAYEGSIRNDFTALNGGAFGNYTGNHSKDIQAIFGQQNPKSAYAQLPNGQPDPKYWTDVFGGFQSLLIGTGKTAQDIQMQALKANNGQGGNVWDPGQAIPQAVVNLPGQVLSGVSAMLAPVAAVALGIVAVVLGMWVLLKDGGGE